MSNFNRFSGLSLGRAQQLQVDSKKAAPAKGRQSSLKKG